ncbi:MAG: type IV pilus modification protein PilV [Pseudomonadota bacterium]
MRVRNGGFTLPEVVIAVLVLAIGIIGAAGAQLTALRTRQQSRLTSDAVQLAAGLADRMRANRAQMRSPDAANPYLQLRYDSAQDGAPQPGARLCYAGAGCDSAQLAQFDSFELKQALHAGFPAARALVCRDTELRSADDAALNWSCSGGAGAPLVIKIGWRARLPGGAAASDDGAPFPPLVAMVVDGAAP